MPSSPEQLKRRDADKFGRFYASLTGRTGHMLNNARQRARRSGVSCTLTSDWLKERLERGHCEVTGLRFDMSAGGGKGHRDNPFSPSVERTDPVGPYSPENCVMTVWIYNRAKGAFRVDDLMKLAHALVAAAGQKAAA